MGLWIARLIARDLYGSTDSLHVAPPDVIQATYAGSAYDEIHIEFDDDVVWQADTLGHTLKNYFFLNDEWGLVESGEVDADGRTVKLYLTEPTAASTLTYLPNAYYHNSGLAYEGPWLRNSRGIGALSFYQFPISGSAAVGAGTESCRLQLPGDGKSRPVQRS